MTSPFEAIAEPSRRRLLDLLIQQPSSVSALVAATGLSQPSTSRHLRILRDAGLVVSHVAGRRRIYEIRAEGFADLARWLTPYVMLWRGEPAASR
jgi:DNA-binding transcriptional ArsR family regulator